MKKVYLALAALAATAATASAIDEPKIFNDMMLHSVSPNGVYALNWNQFYEMVSIVDLTTGEESGYSDPEAGLGGGVGLCISDNGIAIADGSYTNLSYYFDGTEWKELSNAENTFGSGTNAITPDASMIVGDQQLAALSLDENGVMVVPCIWESDGAGGYKTAEIIPYPTTDWTGSVPQYILVNDCSADGSVLVGTIVDNRGMVVEPIMWRRNDAGEWTYNRVHPELLNPENIVIPPCPADFDWESQPNPLSYMTQEEINKYEADVEEYNNRPYPDITDYMSEDGKAAYDEAMAKYEEDPYSNPYPMARDFMTDEELDAYNDAINEYYSVPYPEAVDYMTAEEKAAYEAAMAEWNLLRDDWQDNYDKFDTAYWEAIDAGALMFARNCATVSPDGNLMLANYTKEDRQNFTTVTVPIVFDLTSDNYWEMTEGVTDVYASFINDDGAVLGFANTSDFASRQAVFAPDMTAPLILIQDAVEETDETVYNWIDQNMRHEVEVYDPETYESSLVEKTLTGTPCSTPDFETVLTWVFKSWEDENEDVFSYSYALPLGSLSGIESVVAEAKKANLAVSLAKGGVINIAGAATEVNVYDMNGRLAFSAKNPAATVATGLGQGVYMVKATDAQGNTAIAKAII